MKSSMGAIYKGRPADPGGGRVCGIRMINCYFHVILLFYPDAGGLEILVLAGRPM